MTAIYLVSTRPYTGKTLLAQGLGSDAQSRGKRIAYFKPVGAHPVPVDGVMTDEDALFNARALKLDFSPESLCPVLLTPEFRKQIMSGAAPALLEQVAAAYTKVSQQADVILVGGLGSLFSSGAAYGLPAWTLADALDAHALVVATYQPDATLDELVAAQKTLGARMVGAVINNVHPDDLSEVNASVKSFLEQRGITIFGVLPLDRVLNSIPINELVTGLQGKVLAGEEYLDELVEHFSIGAMNPEAALSHFRKVPNKAVVTGGDRSDIQRAALETSTKALILTGGIFPTNVILSTAAQNKVPVLLVNDDTLTTVERIEGMLGRLRIRQPHKIERAQALVKEHVDLPRLWQAVAR